MADTPQLPIFVITLEDCTDRQATISRSLGDLGLAFEFIPAVDGRQGLPEDALAQVNKAAGAAKLGRPITDAECAASLSHASVYSRIVEGGLDHALIFEDDAIITPGVGKFVEAQGYRSTEAGDGERAGMDVIEQHLCASLHHARVQMVQDDHIRTAVALRLNELSHTGRNDCFIFEDQRMVQPALDNQTVNAG
ncbi:MAG: glycosyltransferase family 25 protein, partial [Pseudomonadota bacterium]